MRSQGLGGVRKGGVGKKTVGGGPALTAARKNRVAQQLIKKALLLRREAARATQRPGASRAKLALPRVTPARVKRAAKARLNRGRGRIGIQSPATDVHSRLGNVGTMNRTNRGGVMKGRRGMAGRGGARGRLGERLGNVNGSPRFNNNNNNSFSVTDGISAG